ncbi:gluconate 2-dehydrogenase subunit 3 family protein [Congregibacter variabilis]|uniref:Gluconate 2-dehydrogenase subunit 3 family protein n=1 Tax=Congregibacter variabilis TaxID=3081200 RepID=A0ABZ0I096_9GAMM|nr:gluconate 2-dehydrogenase subunit 3 family protein [Congregibacter sp. IMCC43200]
MNAPILERRTLLKLGSAAAVTALMSAATPALLAASSANQNAEQFRHLDASLAPTLAAITARILPTTDTPGAREAGAIWFIDSMIGGPLQSMREDLHAGADALNRASGDNFATLSDAEQDAQLRAIENSDFFGLMHMLTLAGTFTMSRYGGNRGEVGWDILGFERRHHWQVPFGYYDAQVHESSEAAQ